MLTLRLTFPWGRYYAHPWGQNPARISEAEWPPSPWRLLRAIAAAWFHANPGQEPSAELIQTLEILGRELPTLVLPKVCFSRAIHYQPNYGVTSKEDLTLAKYKRVRHENHFVAVTDDLLVQWELSGVDDEAADAVRAVLGELAQRISYLGRAESVCEIRVEDALIEKKGLARVSLEGGKPCRRISQSCRDVFCPNPTNFRASDIWQRRDDNATDGMARRHLVQELIDAPQPMPDGAAWYSYQMPDGWPESWVVRHSQPARRRTAPRQVVAHFLEFSLQCRIPVPIKHAVSIAEKFRQAAIRIHCQPSFALSGHDRPPELHGKHLHAFYLPQPDSAGQYISVLRIHCVHGFTQRELNALLGVGALHWAGARFPVRPVLLQLRRDPPRSAESRFWMSLTPFVPPRYWYRKKLAEGRLREPDSPENQLRSTLIDNGLDASASIIRRVEVARADWDVCKVHLSAKARSSGSEPDHRVGVLLSIEFAEPVTLPFPSFGHSSHFGLGQFIPKDSGSPPAAGAAP